MPPLSTTAATATVNQARTKRRLPLETGSEADTDMGAYP
jgi:hypothetical protein